MAVQQLRRAVPGGIGAYARGLLTGLAQASEAGETTDITLYASRPRRRGAGEEPTRCHDSVTPSWGRACPVPS